MTTGEILVIATPLLIVQVILIIFALRDLIRPERVVLGNSKILWGIVVVIFGLIGPLVYFLVGRKEA
jgi:Phospholipase_D-nuclease N-terminal